MLIKKNEGFEVNYSSLNNYQFVFISLDQYASTVQFQAFIYYETI